MEIGINKVRMLELSARTLTVISCRVVLKIMLADATRWDNVERESGCVLAVYA